MDKSRNLKLSGKPIDKFWRSDAEHRDYGQQCCITNLQVAKRVDLKCSKQKINNYVIQ